MWPTQSPPASSPSALISEVMSESYFTLADANRLPSADTAGADQLISEVLIP